MHTRKGSWWPMALKFKIRAQHPFLYRGLSAGHTAWRSVELPTCTVFLWAEPALMKDFLQLYLNQ